MRNVDLCTGCLHKCIAPSTLFYRSYFLLCSIAYHSVWVNSTKFQWECSTVPNDLFHCNQQLQYSLFTKTFTYTWMNTTSLTFTCWFFRFCGVFLPFPWTWSTCNKSDAKEFSVNINHQTKTFFNLIITFVSLN